MSRTIRIFISSTFTGFEEERNILVKKVFPVIRDQCRENGFSFRAVDLRWGITEDEGRNHQVADICFEEIRRCQEYSPAPNFIVLSDDYYGWIPIPASISAYCWEKLASYLEKADPAGLSFLQKWYRRDRNDLAGSYILQDFGRDAAGAVESRISGILFPAAQTVFAGDYSLRVAFGGSMTEQEINLGLFSQKGAEEHTLVMIREPQAGEGPVEAGRSPRSSSGPRYGSCFNAHNLNEHLKRVTEASERNHWISLSGEEFAAEALAFLKGVVKKQIDAVLEEERKESAFDRECRDQREALALEARDYLDADGRMARLEAFIEENRGRPAVVMGGQGSGKTTLLKNYAWQNQAQCIGVFTDLQGSRNSVEAILGFFADALHRRGLLDSTVQRNLGESSAGFFERQLERIRKGTKITLLLDCAEQVSDFSLQEESLFSIALPGGVSFLISCAGQESLSDADRLYAPPVFRVKEMQRREGFSMLMGMLKGYGRTLSPQQQNQIREALPEAATPLYLRHLAAVLRNVRDYGGRAIPDGGQAISGDGRIVTDGGDASGAALFSPAGTALPHDTYTLLRDSLLRGAEAYLPGLSLYAFVCIALSRQGLQEEELIELMSREISTQDRLYRELVQNSHWEIREMKHVLSVFWSRMYFQLQHFLGTYPSRGSLLVRFRHGLMKKAALEIADRHPAFPGILEETSRVIRQYWMEQSPYAVQGGKESGPLPVNRRRAEELVPILRYRGEKDAIGRLLEEPCHLDAMVRLNRCGNLMNDFESAIRDGYAGPHAAAFLELLKRHEILLTSFTDCFLPLCVQHGLADPDVLERIGAAGYFLTGKRRPIGTGRLGGPEKPVDPALQIPGCRTAPVALRSDGIMAVMDRGYVRIYDWNRRRYSAARMPMELKRYDSLYWNGSALVLRRIKSRLRFQYEKKGSGAGEELIPGPENVCPNLLDLFSDQEEKRRLAGNIPEEESAGSRSDRRICYYLRDGQSRKGMLEYPLDMEIEYYARFEQAAIIKEREEIDFVDLSSKMVRETLQLPGVTGVFFSDGGESAIIRTAADELILHRIRDRESRPMPRWQEAGEPFEKALQKQRFLKDFSPGILFAVRKKRDLPWQPVTSPAEGTASPSMTCLSAEGGWFACYYYYNNIARLRVFDLGTGGEILSSTVEPIYRKDMQFHPFRAAAHGTRLVLRSSGTSHVLDLKKEFPSWSRERKKKSLPDRDEDMGGLVRDCKSHMWRWIPRESAYETLKDLTENTFDTALGKLGFRLWRLIFFPLTYSLMAEQTNNPQLVYAPQTVRSGGYLWLIDPLYRTIHVADEKGRWLCHTQAEEPFSAADARGDTLYLLSEDRRQVSELTFAPLYTLHAHQDA